jgi:integrative and conjugative element protein (TIGR02256 family)
MIAASVVSRMYERVLMVRDILDVIHAEVKHSPRTETGGALTGYHSPENTLIITNACGPGPRAELKHASVLVDGKHAQTFCSRVFKESGGRFDYVGDWHRHPGWAALKASKQDLAAMLIIDRAHCCSVPFPVTAIYRKAPEKMVIYALYEQRLVKLPLIWIDKIPN